jgi:hypothetical protein
MSFGVLYLLVLISGVKFKVNNLNFKNLWRRMVLLAEEHGDERLRSTLMNHENRQEYICRKYGVVSDADLTRIKVGIANRKKRK